MNRDRGSQDSVGNDSQTSRHSGPGPSDSPVPARRTADPVQAGRRGINYYSGEEPCISASIDSLLPGLSLSQSQTRPFSLFEETGSPTAVDTAFSGSLQQIEALHRQLVSLRSNISASPATGLQLLPSSAEDLSSAQTGSMSQLRSLIGQRSQSLLSLQRLELDLFAQYRQVLAQPQGPDTSALRAAQRGLAQDTEQALGLLLQAEQRLQLFASTYAEMRKQNLQFILTFENKVQVSQLEFEVIGLVGTLCCG
ncbi:hypothetical protein EON64_16880 [archaeon]|nr:MAG: hypothetical protein EON64_16880 [archaeon]